MDSRAAVPELDRSQLREAIRNEYRAKEAQQKAKDAEQKEQKSGDASKRRG